jgi:hypothetical protein
MGTFSIGKPEGRDPVGHTGIAGRIILKYILVK